MSAGLLSLADEFLSFHKKYSSFFQLKTKSVIAQSRHYLCGLMQAVKRNMERMVEVVPESNWQSMQNFISHSPWDGFSLMDQIARDANALIGADADTCLVIDESAITKKGNKSVGVARQWNGRLGKVDNCQVGVYAALNRRDQVSLIDGRLFLPKSWTDDKERCQRAGIPRDRLEHKKKAELALEMVQSAREKGLSYHWIGADAFYGEHPEFVRQLDQAGETFMVDVHCDQTIYLEDPHPYLPEHQSERRGRKPKRLKTDVRSTTVAQWANSQPESSWETVFIRDSSKGALTAKVLQRRIWLWNGEEARAHCWHLIVRRENGSKNYYKYSISNANENTSIQRLAFMQGQRFWVERAIEDAKTSAGLADYQVRHWDGWHHHMAMVMLALLFLLQIKIKYKDSYELLSCNDIRELLSHFLPRRDITKEEVLYQMKIRHQKRAQAIEFFKKQKI